MNIILINPNTYTKYPQPPLGLLSVGTLLMGLGHRVKIIDINANTKLNNTILEWVEEADIVGITATSLSFKEAVKVANAVKANYPDKYIMLGGVQATIAPQQAMDTGVFDCVVRGEGDNEEYLQHIITTRERGVIYGNDNLTNLDKLPILAYHLLDGYKYKPMPPHGMHGAVMPMLTSRGCPYKCSFCSKAVFGSKYRSKSPGNIIEEIVALQRRGIKEIAFYDDIFGLKKDEAMCLLDMLEPLGMHWTCQSRVNLVDAEILKAMHRAGCFAIAYGLESGSPEILKAISKDITLEQTERAVRLTQEAGIRVIGYFMLGSPGETGETMDATVQWAIKLNPDYAQFSITTPLPGSEIWDQRQFNSYSMGGIGNGLCDISGRDLNITISKAYESFYIRPKYILRQAKRALTSWAEFKSTIKGLITFTKV